MIPWPVPFSLRVDHVYDGDTIMGDLTADAGLDVGVTFRAWSVRLYGINAPEMNSSDPAKRLDAVACRDYLRGLAPAGSVVSVVSYSFDKYGRRVDGIPVVGGVDLCGEMLRFGHGVVAL